MGKFSNIYTLQNNFRAGLTGFRFRKPSISIFSKYSLFSKYSFSKKRLIILGLIILFIVILSFLFKASTNSSNFSKPQSLDQRFSLPSAKASVTVNKEFSFPLKDGKGVEVSSLKYAIENAELRDQIIVKGQKASAIKGRTFLIINIKIVNDYEKSIEINTKDYVRLSVNGNDKELLAPDIHNDPVTIQAISTKYSRVGFPINDTDRNLRLKVGEINGEKQTIDLNLNQK